MAKAKAAGHGVATLVSRYLMAPAVGLGALLLFAAPASAGEGVVVMPDEDSLGYRCDQGDAKACAEVERLAASTEDTSNSQVYGEDTSFSEGAQSFNGKNLSKQPVEEIQDILGMEVTGVYDADTAYEVVKWQDANGLPVTGNWTEVETKQAAENEKLSETDPLLTEDSSTEAPAENSEAVTEKSSAPWLIAGGTMAVAVLGLLAFLRFRRSR